MRSMVTGSFAALAVITLGSGIVSAQDVKPVYIGEVMRTGIFPNSRAIGQALNATKDADGKVAAELSPEAAGAIGAAATKLAEEARHLAEAPAYHSGDSATAVPNEEEEAKIAANLADFRGMASALSAHASKIAAAAAARDGGQAAELNAATGQYCGACHTAYRPARPQA